MSILRLHLIASVYSFGSSDPHSLVRLLHLLVHHVLVDVDLVVLGAALERLEGLSGSSVLLEYLPL